jgi:Family of unknown function (DUF6112)
MSTSTTPAETSRAEKLAWKTGAIAGIVLALVAIPVRAFADPGPFIPVKPDMNAPGAKALSQLAAYVLTYVMYAALIGALGSLVALAIGKGIGEHRAVQGGKTGLLISVGVAFLAGMITTVLNSAWVAGSQG